jgi:hypothetical protein
MARSYVDALPEGSTTRITDIRKTTPGLRILERYAVRVGGAHNHRDNLGSAVLIKDNHIAACGGVGTAISRARARAPHTSRIECEVDSLEQLDQALAAGADIVLLDNMDDDMVREAVRRAKGRAITEASGGITLARIPALARLGVDVISAGAAAKGRCVEGAGSRRRQTEGGRAALEAPRDIRRARAARVAARDQARAERLHVGEAGDPCGRLGVDRSARGARPRIHAALAGVEHGTAAAVVVGAGVALRGVDRRTAAGEARQDERAGEEGEERRGSIRGHALRESNSGATASPPIQAPSATS